MTKENILRRLDIERRILKEGYPSEDYSTLLMLKEVSRVLSMYIEDPDIEGAVDLILKEIY